MHSDAWSLYAPLPMLVLALLGVGVYLVSRRLVGIHQAASASLVLMLTVGVLAQWRLNA